MRLGFQSRGLGGKGLNLGAQPIGVDNEGNNAVLSMFITHLYTNSCLVYLVLLLPSDDYLENI